MNIFNFKNKKNNNSGVTLISLIITIIVLIILAMIIILMLYGNSSIILKAVNARDKTIDGQSADTQIIKVYEDEVSKYPKENKKREIIIPEGLKIGSLVTYEPTGSTYKWQGKYATDAEITKIDGVDTTTYDVLLDSTSSGGNRITAKWKVFKIDRTSGKIQLVPTQTKATVTLGGAPGYNNAVQLLDAACSALYSEPSKGITARSIDMDDIEPLLVETKIQTAKDNYRAYLFSEFTEFGTYLDANNQIKTAYNKNSSYFPRIYEEEVKSVINGKLNTNGLELSTPGKKLYERGEVTSLTNQTTETNATIGYFRAKTNIKPYLTYYYWENSLNKSENYKEYGSTYATIFSNNAIWIATRCNVVCPSSSYFSVRRSFRGTLYNDFMISSSCDSYNKSESLFPVVTLDGDLIVKDGSYFKVK